jgi:type IV secretory pathway VirB10-like protein
MGPSLANRLKRKWNSPPKQRPCVNTQSQTNGVARRLVFTIALGVIVGAAEATNANAGYDESGSEAYKAGVASSLSQTSANVLDRFINIPPTITIREGHRIKVYITQDMLLPAYANHDMPGVM